MRGYIPTQSNFIGLAMPTVNFLSYNSTGLNEAKLQWINDLMITTDASFTGIQEHFRKSKTVEDLFVKNFPSNYCHIKPGHRSVGQENRCPKGGLAQLVRKNLDIKVKNLKSENFIIQAQILVFPTNRLL